MTLLGNFVWTRQGEGGRVEGKDDEEVLHEDLKEEPDALQAHPLDPIPELTSRIAHASFPKGTLAMHLRDALGPIYEDADFADLFPKRGRAAEAPWRLALVTVEALAGKSVGPSSGGDGSSTLGLEIGTFLAAG
jgi:hypothetical protein